MDSYGKYLESTTVPADGDEFAGRKLGLLRSTDQQLASRRELVARHPDLRRQSG
jgi:hypothetical protein